MILRSGIGLAVFVVMAGACGGRFDQRGEDGAASGSGGAAAAGTSAYGGTGNATSAGGSSAVARGGTAAKAGSATGGAVSTSGTSPGEPCLCDQVACGPGTQPVPNANGCCFHCESICQNIMCPGIACASGSHIQQTPGQCCPTCILDSCFAQHMGYAADRQQLVDKYSEARCNTVDDCSVYYEKNACEVGCGIAIPTSTLSSLDSNLQSYAQRNCSENCAPPIPPCLPKQLACFFNRCTFDSGLGGAGGEGGVFGQ